MTFRRLLGTLSCFPFVGCATVARVPPPEGARGVATLQIEETEGSAELQEAAILEAQNRLTQLEELLKTKQTVVVELFNGTQFNEDL